MTNLLSAQFSKLFKNKMFYAAVIIFAAIGFVSTMLFFRYIPDLAHFAEEAKANGDTEYLQNMYETSIMFDISSRMDFHIIVFAPAIFISMFIGREFDNNTIRNKVIVGSSRLLIYLSNLIVCFVAQLIMHIVYCLSAFIPSIIVYLKYRSIINMRFFDISFKDFLLSQVIGIGIMLVCSSLYLLITMTAGSRTRAVISSIIVILAMFLVSNKINTILYVPNEEDYNYYIPTYTETTDTPDTSNFIEFDPYFGYDSYTNYVESYRGKNLKGGKRFLYETIDDTLPTSQALYIMSSDATSPRTGKIILCDLLFSVVLSAVGIIIFNRKELR